MGEKGENRFLPSMLIILYSNIFDFPMMFYHKKVGKKNFGCKKNKNNRYKSGCGKAGLYDLYNGHGTEFECGICDQIKALRF